ncbi:MAG: ATP-dependent DNA helicase RecG, partial [Planctomycetales bacterium]
MIESIQTPDRTLAQPIQFAPGVGPMRAESLAKLGLRTVSDALFYFPRDWQDLTNLTAIDELEENVPACVRGVVDEIDVRGAASGKSALGVLIRQRDQFLRAMWFNMPFLAAKFSRGQDVLLEGKPKRRYPRWEMHHPQIRWLENGDQVAGRMLPVYRLTEGVSQGQVRETIKTILEQHADAPQEVFPKSFREARDLWPISRALKGIHFPDDRVCLDRARRRFVYQELFVMQLALAMRKRKHQDERQAPSLETTAKIDARIRRLLPFELTDGQNQAIAEITKDMASTRPMNRLLQGEVGSGKTAAAVYAMLAAVASGRQAVLMAPTEILARQHWRTLNALLSESQVRRALIVGGIGVAQRREILKSLADGDVDLAVGTQALLEDDVVFHDLGLAVVDEQHKFGVRQRAGLRGGTRSPHYLVMTATPIPRTVGMTLYGDLDVTTLRDAPPGRQPVHTYLAEPDQRESWWEFVRKKLNEGRQGYVVTPLVEGSENLAGVEATFQLLAAGPLRGFRLGLVHGRLSAEEKDAAMR